MTQENMGILNGMPFACPDPKTPGFIMENYSSKEKAQKYVDLLLPEKETRMLLGEPGIINNSYMPNLYELTMTELEWFASFIGLKKIVENGDGSVVQAEFLARPRAVGTLLRYIYKTPFIGPSSLAPRNDRPPFSRPQSHPSFFLSMKDGVVGLLVFLLAPPRVEKFAPIITGHKYFKEAITQLIIFLNLKTSTPTLRDFTIAILSSLLSSPSSSRALPVILSFPSIPSLIRSSLSSVSATIGTLGNQVINIMESNTPTQSEEARKEREKEREEREKKVEKKCAACGVEAKNICSRCRAVRYCSKEHQKDHWNIHKLGCISR